MRYIINILVVIPFVFFFSCAKDQIDDVSERKKPSDRLLAERFSNLKIVENPVVILSGDTASVKDLLEKRKRSDLIFLRDSIWPNRVGRSSFYESDEMVITPSNRLYIYPGATLKASSIANDEFEPFIDYQKAPIRVNLSFPSSQSNGIISEPSLSESRIFLRDAIMSPDFSGRYIDDFQQTISYFSRYNQVKLAFGYNVNEKRIFSSTNTSFDSNSSDTQYATKLMVSYTVKNFTYSMLDPVEGELFATGSLPADAFDGISPVFINSVTYGRFGLLVVESQNNASQVKTTFEKVVNKILKKTSETFTQEERTLFQSCRITLYVLGSTLGESATQLLINPDPEAFTGFLTENVGAFTSSDPGVPIFFTAKYLKDNSPFKTVFKLDFPM